MAIKWLISKGIKKKAHYNKKFYKANSSSLLTYLRESN